MSNRAALLCCALLTLMIVPSTASATHVQCGDVITQDTTLDSDLVDCPGDGVVIGASGITLDLAGHAIDGTGVGAGNQGIENNGADDVSVSNGRIQEFQAAVSIRLGEANVLSDLELTDSGIALYLEEASFTRIRDSLLTRSSAGVLVFREGSFIQIDRNVISHTGTAIFVAGFGFDVLQGNQITKNEVFGNDTAMLVNLTTDTLIQGNSVHDNLGDFAAIWERGASARIERNTVRRNTGMGILVQRLGAQVVDNRVLDNETDGIAISDSADFVDVSDNFVHGNGDDGIDADSASVTIARNKAIHDGDFGIEAVPGVTDDGGNKASANGNPLQCLNVSCK